MQEKYCFMVPQNLEAAMCILLFKWLAGKNNINIIISNENMFKNDLKRLDLNDFKFVYVIGFYNLTELPNILDDKKIIYINKKIETDKIENSRIITGEKTTTELFFNFLSKYSEKTLTANQLFLYNNVVKYFNYNIEEDLSPLKLFYFFKTLKTQNKVEFFVKRFENGLVLFNENENLLLNIILKDLSNTLKHLKIYKGEILYDNVKYITSSCFGTKYVNEVSHRLLKLTNSDIAIVINMEKNNVHYRKNKKSSLNLGDLVKNQFEGFGTEYAGFSNLNNKIIEITKSFFPFVDK